MFIETLTKMVVVTMTDRAGQHGINVDHGGLFGAARALVPRAITVGAVLVSVTMATGRPSFVLC